MGGPGRHKREQTMTTRNRVVRRIGGIVLAAGLFVAGPVAADDRGVRDAVANAVLGSVHYGVFDSVGVGVQDGVVTLVGSVLRPWHRDDIAQRVARVDGVRELRNEIRVQPVSSFDDRLRRQLYREVYGRVLPQYSGVLSPPVRIVVENGNITLTGIVNSRVEKVMLESIARGTLAFRVSNQVQVESEIEKES